MPQVATDRIQSELPDVIPDGTQRINATPDAFGAPQAQAAQGLAQGFQQVSNAAQQVQDRYDATAVGNAFSQLRDRVTNNSWGDPQNPNAPPGLLTLQGEQAMRAYPDAVSRIRQAQSDIATTLTPAQARQFNLEAQRFVGDTVSSYDAHRAQAQQQWQVNSLDSQAATAQSSAIANSADDAAFGHAIQDGRNAIVSKASQLGWSSDQTVLALNDYTSKTYSGVTEKLAEANPQAAWAYYRDHRTVMTGPDQIALEGRLRPALLAWGSRDSANDIIARNSGGAAPLVPGILQEAQQQGVGASLALTSAKIESNLGQASDRPGADPQGVFQMTAGTWAARGGTPDNRGDVPTQIKLGVANLAHSAQVAQQALGAQPQDWQTYLVHQQGDGGGAALLKADPMTPAVDALAPAYGGSIAKARAAVTGNGGSTDMSAGQFLSLWQNKYAAAAASIPTPDGTGPNAFRPNVTAMMDEAAKVRDPFGQDNPQYQDLVQSRIRAKLNIDEYAEREAQKSNRDVLFGALLGGAAGIGTASAAGSLLAPGGAPSGVVAGAAGGQSATPQSTPGITAQAGPLPPIAGKPTDLNTLLATPAVRQAWINATPELQQAVLTVLNQNSRAYDPPENDASMASYYKLRGMAADNPGDFKSQNLADPALLTTLPHHLLLDLMNRQAAISTNDAKAAQAGINLMRAQQVVSPDIRQAGLNPGAKPGTPAADAYAQFTGRLDDALQQFQATNSRRPNDSEVKQIGQSLLTQGWLRGTGSLWGALPNDTPVRLYQAQSTGKTGQFYPNVPTADRAQITSSFQAQFGRAPTDAEVQQVFMLHRQQRPGGPPRSAAAGALSPTTLPLAAQDEGSSGPGEPTPPGSSAPASSTPAAAAAPSGGNSPIIPGVRLSGGGLGY